MKRVTKVFVAFIAVTLLGITSAQASWTATPSYSKAFIENKAQFNGRNKLENSKILYAIDHGPFQVYFTKEGLTYRLDKKLKRKKWDKTIPLNNEREWNDIMEMRRAINMITEVIHMNWVNSNPNVEIIAVDPTPDYFSYAMGSNNINYNHIKGYKKLIYKNLYNGIDAVYEFHPTEGFKYSFIIHPGADPSVIKLQYSDDANIETDIQGNLKFSTQFGPITDHAPSTFYGNNHSKAITSSFRINNNVVSFDLGNYDKNQKIIIDPWVVLPPSPNSNKVWEVETDNSGNVYTYSGDMPITLRKYDAAGSLQWTYLSAWDSSGFWIGGMITHPSGDTYICSGSNGEIRKISTAGTQQWYNNPNGLTSYEYWSFAFNCDLTKLAIGGSRLTFSIPFPIIRGTVMEINLANGALVTTTVVGYGALFGIPPSIQEVSSLCSAPNGNYYFLTLDTVGAIKDDLTTILFKDSTTYNFDYYIPGYGFGTKQPISTIRATSTHFFTHNGIIIDKRDLSNGAVIATASIPSGISNGTLFGTNVMGNGGLDVDSCGNVYVGSGNGVYKFDSNLNLITSATTPGPVYDVDVSNNGEVAASGSNFVATVSLSACNSPVAICITTMIVTASSTNVECAGECNGTASANQLGGTPPFTYAWSNGETTQNITGLCAGSYTVIITDAASLVDSATVTIIEPLPISTGMNSINATCGASNGVANVAATGGTGTLTYLWSPTGGTAATASGLPAGTYTVTVTDDNGCSATNSVTINSTGGPQVTVASQTDANCNGAATGSAEVTATAGAPPYTYSWSTVPVQTTPIATGLAAGTYTVTVTDSLGCISSQSITIIEPDSITIATSVVSDDFCGNSNGSASATPSGGTPGYTYSWNTIPVQTTQQASGLAFGTYIVTVTDTNGCTETETVVIDEIAAPTASISAQVNILCNGGNNGSATVTATGGTIPYQFAWSTNPVQTSATATNLTAGVYTVIITDQSGCTTSQSATITEPDVLVINTLSTTATCGQANGSSTAAVSGGTPTYSYSWNTNPVQTTPTAVNLAAGTYTVTVTDQSGCTSTQTATIIETANLTITSTSTAASCGQANGSATVSVTGGSPTYTYSWNTVPVQTGETATNLNSGTYTVTVTDLTGCSSTQTVTVAEIPSFTASAANTPACGDGNGTATVTTTGGAGPFTYSWLPSGGTGSTATGLSAGTYTCNITDANGCTGSASVVVVIYPDVIASAGSDVTIDEGATTQLSASGGTSYSWLPATGLSCTNCQSPEASPESTTTYCVLVTDDNGCTATACVKVTIDIVCGEVYVPTAFSPDGSNDPENEKQCVYGNCIQSLEFAVFTRWGEKVFETTDQKKCWDGTYKGEQLNTGIYVYYLKATLLDGTKISRKGDVSLIR